MSRGVTGSRIWYACRQLCAAAGRDTSEEARECRATVKEKSGPNPSGRCMGLTGGTGSGKSEAAKRFRERGIPVIDADRIGHAVLRRGGTARDSVIAAFGPAIVTGGEIDREKLGALVFADGAARVQLNAIVHPAIRAEIQAYANAFQDAGFPVVLVDAALLGESGKLDAYLDGLILVSSPVHMRRARLEQHRGMAPEAVARRMAAQRDPELKRPLANWIIENDGALSALHRQVDAVAEDLCAHVA